MPPLSEEEAWRVFERYCARDAEISRLQAEWQKLLLDAVLYGTGTASFGSFETQENPVNSKPPKDEDLPALERLIKMMKMTTAEDNVALVAIRKVNALLAENGWDWEKVLRGKIKVVEDPFKGLNIPPRAFDTTPKPQPTPRPQQTPFRPRPMDDWAREEERRQRAEEQRAADRRAEEQRRQNERYAREQRLRDLEREARRQERRQEEAKAAEGRGRRAEAVKKYFEEQARKAGALNTDDLV